MTGLFGKLNMVEMVVIRILGDHCLFKDRGICLWEIVQEFILECHCEEYISRSKADIHHM